MNFEIQSFLLNILKIIILTATFLQSDYLEIKKLKKNSSFQEIIFELTVVKTKTIMTKKKNTFL